MEEKTYDLKLSHRQHATILAALRCWQQQSDHEAWPLEMDIATCGPNGEIIEPLSDEEIDELCEEINQ